VTAVTPHQPSARPFPALPRMGQLRYRRRQLPWMGRSTGLCQLARVFFVLQLFHSSACFLLQKAAFICYALARVASYPLAIR
jgi:hypothetical protein